MISAQTRLRPLTGRKMRGNVFVALLCAILGACFLADDSGLPWRSTGDSDAPAGKGRKTATSIPLVKVPDIAQLPSQPQDALIAYFGEPSLRRQEDGAQFWTYTNDRCRLYFIFYDEGGGDYRLHHFEVETAGAKPPTYDEELRLCLDHVARSHQLPQEMRLDAES